MSVIKLLLNMSLLHCQPCCENLLSYTHCRDKVGRLYNNGNYALVTCRDLAHVSVGISFTDSRLKQMWVGLLEKLV